MKKEENFVSAWHKQPDLIRQFLDNRQDYEKLCAEVTYILQKRFSEQMIEVSTVSWRAKTLESFLEKIERKKYNNPLNDINDFAGIRIVYLYTQDAQAIEKVIRDEFTILEKVDKLEEREPNHFGYLATHFIASLGKNSVGARYDDLKNLKFEIQVRTVLQDAWAIIDHHLAYKNENEVPKHLLRRIISIAAMFEVIDHDFNQIQQEITQYITGLKESSQSHADEFLKNDLNLSSFLEYLSWKFPEFPPEKFVGQAKMIFDDLQEGFFSNLSDIDILINKTAPTRNIASANLRGLDGEPNYGAVQVSLSLGIANKQHRNFQPLYPEEWRIAIEMAIEEQNKKSNKNLKP